MKVGKYFTLFNDGKRYLCVYQKFNKRSAKAYCCDCKNIFIVDPNELFEKRKCPKCNELLYKKWCKVND